LQDSFRMSENVYNLLPGDEILAPKPPRYVSKFKPAVLLETKANKDPMRTMGPAKVEVPSPDKYLKKHSKEPRSPDKMQISQRHACTVKKPPVPARTDNPPMGIHTKKNFIRTAIFVTVKPKPAIVDTNKGHKQLLDNSGHAPKYTKKKGLPLIIDTISQKQHKQCLEAKMSQVEKDIDILERFKTIYIPNE
uniref:Enkurin domain-containing protein n=1 Tax=Mola mola TaxID=94237 RepID=A0A3Q3VTL0_MOLML